MSILIKLNNSAEFSLLARGISLVKRYLPYFVRSGMTIVNLGTNRHLGLISYNWASSAASYNSPTKATAYYVGIYPETIAPSYGPYDHSHAFPIRCLVY